MNTAERLTLWRMKYERRRLKENLWIWLAWLLPRELVKWAAIRLMAHATQGEWSSQNVPELTAMDALKRWK